MFAQTSVRRKLEKLHFGFWVEHTELIENSFALFFSFGDKISVSVHSEVANDCKYGCSTFGFKYLFLPWGYLSVKIIWVLLHFYFLTYVLIKKKQKTKKQPNKTSNYCAN